MAKKKAESSAAKPKLTPKAKAVKSTKAADDRAASADAATKKLKTLGPPLTAEEIGHVAGEVWTALSTNGGQTIAALKKSVNASDELVLAALGWLARENKLAFETNGRSVTVSLA